MADQQDVQNQQTINDLYEKRAKLAKSISDIEAKALKAQGEFLTSIEKKAIIAQNELKLQQDIVSAISIKQKAEKDLAQARLELQQKEKELQAVDEKTDKARAARLQNQIDNI